jgi:two-component system, NarL family, response regulator NreC
MSGYLRVVRDESADGSADPERVRVVLAEDHDSLRRNLRRLLEGEEDVEVVGEARDLESAVREVRRQRPEVLVLGLRVPAGSGLDGIGRLREQSPYIEIVIISMDENEMYARQAFEAGAIAFVLKDSADVELSPAVRSAARGLQYTSPRLRRP